jgi:ribosome-associated toxin RatA of RatAB toxin-antitoxin module
MSGSKFLQFSFDAKWTVNQSNANSTSVKFDISIKTPLAILTKRLQNIISNVSLETIDMFIKRINFLYKDGNK